MVSRTLTRGLRVAAAVRLAARPSSLGAQIYGIVRARILTGKIAPGAVIDEKAIAMELGVSRTPVREAVKKLSDENLVEVKAQSGTLASRINRKLIHEAYLIRRALEVENIGHAAVRVSMTDIKALEDINSRHVAALQRHRFVEAIGLDDEFHRQISEISDLPQLWQVVVVSKAHLDRCRYMNLPRPGQAEITLKQHRAIIDALAGQSAAKARKAMKDHLDMSYQGIVDFLLSTDHEAHVPMI